MNNVSSKYRYNLIAGASMMAFLTACGGGADIEEPTTDVAVSQSEGGEAVAEPAFHRLPASIDEPDDVDRDGSQGSRNRMGKLSYIPSKFATMDTKLVTDESAANFKPAAGREQAQSVAKNPVVYTPAQIRAAYQMPEIPKDLTNLTPKQAADLGAGQTIYIIGAYHHPSLIKDLKLFNNRFGLPDCKEVAIPVGTTTLAPHDPAAGCTISVVYTNMGSRIMTTPPKYNASWAAEMALDTQWAHATAPLARIIVLESLNNFATALADSIRLANNFGPGVVSMSFVSTEQSFVKNYDTFFQGEGMTYIAAAGDRGVEANWPSASPRVLSVGGTTLNSYIPDSYRNETAWSKSGGGYSSYFPMPDWQNSIATALMPTTGLKSWMPSKPARAVTDVSFNADPYTGQYVVITSPANVSKWYSYGGTSIGTPQWAGIVAVTNANRKLNNLPTLGVFTPRLYSMDKMGAVADVTTGSNGACVGCMASSGWDVPTGWGTPNVKAVIEKLSVD